MTSVESETTEELAIEPGWSYIRGANKRDALYCLCDSLWPILAYPIDTELLSFSSEQRIPDCPAGRETNRVAS